MKKGGIYKHKSSKDVAVECKRILFIPEKKGYKVKVSWVNVSSGEFAYPVGLVEEIFIPSNLIKEWLPWQKNTETTTR
jgi:hypothetical protein